MDVSTGFSLLQLPKPAGGNCKLAAQYIQRSGQLSRARCGLVGASTAALMGFDFEGKGGEICRRGISGAESTAALEFLVSLHGAHLWHLAAGRSAQGFGRGIIGGTSMAITNPRHRKGSMRVCTNIQNR